MSTWNTIISNRFNQSFSKSASFCLGKKDQKQQYWLLQREGAGLTPVLQPSLRDGANWQENGSGGWRRRSSSLFLGSAKTVPLQNSFYFSVGNITNQAHEHISLSIIIQYTISTLYTYILKKPRLSSCVQAQGDSQIEKSLKTLFSNSHFLFKANHIPPV